MDDDIDETDEQTRQTVIRIIAMLYALAQLLDRAVHAPRPVRRFVIWVMRAGERRISGYVLQEAYDRGCKRLPAAMFEPRCRNSKAEALRIADCFRAMAWFLGALHGHHPMEPPAGGWHVSQFKSPPRATTSVMCGGLLRRAFAGFSKRVAIIARARASPPIPDTS